MSIAVFLFLPYHYSSVRLTPPLLSEIGKTRGVKPYVWTENPKIFGAPSAREINVNSCKNKFLSTSSAAGEKFLGYFDVRLRFLLRISSFLTPNPQNFPLRGRSNTPPYGLTPPPCCRSWKNRGVKPKGGLN